MYDVNQSVALESGAVEEGAVLNDGLYAETHLAHHEHAHHHSPTQEKWLIRRNIFVFIAAVLFLASLLPEAVIGHSGYTLKGIAYMFGALAYGSEFLMLTDGFKKKETAKELFMPSVFGVLYIILGISYFMHH